MSRKVSEILREARELIANPESWTRNNYAKDADNRAVPVTNRSACKFCALGAVKRAGWDEAEGSKAECLLDDIAWSVSRFGIVTVNDLRGHEEVLRVFDKAIRVAEAEERGDYDVLARAA